MIKRVSLLGSAGLLATAGIAVAIATTSPPADAISPLSAADPSQVQNFSVFKTPAVALPKDASEALGQLTAGDPSLDLLPAQARRAATSDGRPAWVVPGKSSICLIAENSEGIGVGCTPTRYAVSGKFALVARSVVGGEDTVTGLVPDRISRAAAVASDGGRVAAASVSANVYSLKGVGIAKVNAVDSKGAVDSAFGVTKP